MRSHVDWLTFTMSPIYNGCHSPCTPEEEYTEALWEAFYHVFGEKLTADVFVGSWEQQMRSRAPYTDAWKFNDGNITLFASRSLSHCCVEISGLGCEQLIESGQFRSVLGCVKERVTRIDIAVDMQTEISPKTFVESRTGKRSKSYGYQISASGETCYVGSQSSDSYARVYRYFEPHPRSHLLRAEHVFRREISRAISCAILSDGLSSVTKACGKRFGWTDNNWQLGDVDASDLSIPRTTRSDAKTVFWLVHSVAPSFKRLIQSGEIVDGEEFIRRYFLGEE